MIFLWGALVIMVLALVSHRIRPVVVFPPFVYAFLWTSLLALLGCAQGMFYGVQIQTMLLMVGAAISFVVGGLIATVIYSLPETESKTSSHRIGVTPARRRSINRCIDIFIVLQVVAAPWYIHAFLQQAALLSSGDLAAGLRLVGMGEESQGMGGVLGFFGYFSFAAKICAFISVSLLDGSKASKRRAVLAILMPALYSILTMGRTGTMFVLVGCAGIYLLHNRMPNAKKVFASACAFVLIFAIPAILLRKGVDEDATATKALIQVGGSITQYAVAPLVAFGIVTEEPHLFERNGSGYVDFFAAAAYKLGWTTNPPPSSINPYIYTPNPTNVYPIYMKWYLDFGYIGAAVGMILLGGVCTIIFLSAQVGHPIGIALFGLVINGVCTTFMGDAFLTSLSIWLQTIIVGVVLFYGPLLQWPRIAPGQWYQSCSGNVKM